MATQQKRIYELIEEYFPNASDDFSNIYLSVDSASYSPEAKKMPLSVLFDNINSQVVSDLKIYPAGTININLDYTDEGFSDFITPDYRLDLKIYTIDTDSQGRTYKTSLVALNQAQTISGFSFLLYKDYGKEIYVDYKSETR